MEHSKLKMEHSKLKMPFFGRALVGWALKIEFHIKAGWWWTIELYILGVYLYVFQIFSNSSIQHVPI